MKFSRFTEKSTLIFQILKEIVQKYTSDLLNFKKDILQMFFELNENEISKQRWKKRIEVPSLNYAKNLLIMLKN